MKKIILIFTTILIVVSSLLLFASARDNKDYTSVLEFQETTKAYPIMNGLENAIGFGEYYSTDNLNVNVFPDAVGEMRLNIIYDRYLLKVVTFEANGQYPPASYVLSNTSDYSDVGFYLDDQNKYCVFGVKNGVNVNIGIWQDLTGFGTAFNYATSKYTLREGYRVDFPFNPIDDMEKPLMQNLIDGLKEFVPGIAIAFPVAFTSIFMTNGHFNALSIVLLSFFGLMLGYGVVRFITSLFRKET